MAIAAPRPRNLWKLARGQHGVLTHGQLLDAGLSPAAIKHRLARGRLHRIHIAVYAVGVLDLTRRGRWMAAVLACGPGAALSYGSAASLFGIDDREGYLSVSVPSPRDVRRTGIRVHRTALLPEDIGLFDRIPVTSPTRTLIDLATEVTPRRLEAAVNVADKLGLVDPEALRDEVARRPGQHGVPTLRALLDRDTFALTDSELERRFLRLVRRAGLPRPETGIRIAGFKVDFLWRDLGLVVETDGLRYHRTEIQQARDRRRDQSMAAAGLTCLRFTHAQVSGEPGGVGRTLAAVVSRLADAQAA